MTLTPPKNSRNTMKLIHSTAATLLALLLTLFIPLAIAGPGHDHGDTAPQATSSALPRFTAVSEDLELVGIVITSGCVSATLLRDCMNNDRCPITLCLSQNGLHRGDVVSVDRA